MSLSPSQIICIVAGIVIIGLIIGIVIMATSQSKDAGTDDDAFWITTTRNDIEHWVLNNNSMANDLQVPLSFDVRPGYFDDIPGYTQKDFDENKNDEDRYNKHIAMFNQQYGTSTYDAAVYTVCVSHHITLGSEEPFYLDNAYRWLRYLSLPVGYPDVESPILINPRHDENWRYLDTPLDWPDHAIGSIGYFFRNVPVSQYQTNTLPLPCTILNASVGGALFGDIRSTRAECEVNTTGLEETDQLYTLWSDYRPVSGENLWTLLATVHLLSRILDTDKRETLELLARRIVLTSLALEADKDDDGGVLAYSPQRYKDDGDIDTSVQWNQFQFSVENMCSAAAALYAFGTADGINNTEAKEAQQHAVAFAKRIAVRVRDHHMLQDFTYTDTIQGQIRVDGWSINQGGEFATSSPWSVTEQGTQLATDCTTWGISVFGRLFEQEEDGRCFELWQNIKLTCGFTNDDGDFAGLGYSFNQTDNVLSAEWTIGGLFAAQIMLKQLYSDDTQKAETLRNDIAQMEASMLTQITDDTRVGGKALLYCNKRNYMIPFGWLGQANASLASSGWYLMYLDKRNPWRIDGLMDFVMPIF